MTDPESRAAARDLIGALIRGERRATPEDIAAIRALMATAPFDPRAKPIPVDFRGHPFMGEALGARAPSLTYHLSWRTIIDEQWAIGTAESEYIADLQRAIRLQATRLGVYARRGGNVAAALARTADVLEASYLGAKSLPLLLVVYSPDRDIIVTGYQCSSLEEVSIPEEARWLTD